ncbi:hypothetical protein [Thermofilum sp.]|uniref:hypothetical protein n=2 Tax=Thermofilum sp. TaxID=1961369 RepID=UPI0031624CF8
MRARTMSSNHASSGEKLSRPGILFYIFLTDEKALEKLRVNAIPLSVQKPEKGYPLIFRDLLPSLRLIGIDAFPHNNLLYFMFGNNQKSIINDLRITLDRFYTNSKDALTYTWRTPSLEELISYDNPSHFVITRSLLYSYFKRTWRNKSRIILLRRSMVREGLRVYLTCEDVASSSEYNYRICTGLRILFEVTPKHRGYLWFDIITQAFEENEIDRETKPLSHREMKTLSKRLSINLYDKYLQETRMNPRDRAEKINDLLKNYLNVDNVISINDYIYNPLGERFEEITLKFKKLHDIS